jgi:hypothetical protein
MPDYSRFAPMVQALMSRERGTRYQGAPGFTPGRFDPSTMFPDGPPMGGGGLGGGIFGGPPGNPDPRPMNPNPSPGYNTGIVPPGMGQPAPPPPGMKPPQMGHMGPGSGLAPMSPTPRPMGPTPGMAPAMGAARINPLIRR